MKKRYYWLWVVGILTSLTQSVIAQPLRRDSVTSFQPGATLRLETGVNTYGPLTVGNHNLIAPLTLDVVTRFTRDNRQQPTSGLWLHAVVDPTQHRLTDPAYAPYTLLQTGRLGADLNLFVESSPVPNLSLHARAGGGLRFYPLFDEQRDWRWYETYEQLMGRIGAGVTYRLRTEGDARHQPKIWGLLEGSFDYRRQRHDFTSRSEAYYRQYISQPIVFSSLQAQLRFTYYWSPRTGLELAGNWYGRPTTDPHTQYADLRLGFVWHMGAQANATGGVLHIDIKNAEQQQEQAADRLQDAQQVLNEANTTQQIRRNDATNARLAASQSRKGAIEARTAATNIQSTANQALAIAIQAQVDTTLAREQVVIAQATVKAVGDRLKKLPAKPVEVVGQAKNRLETAKKQLDKVNKKLAVAKVALGEAVKAANQSEGTAIQADSAAIHSERAARKAEIAAVQAENAAKASAEITTQAQKQVAQRRQILGEATKKLVRLDPASSELTHKFEINDSRVK